MSTEKQQGALKWVWALGALLLLAAAVRLYGITNPLNDWNAWRQAETAALARNYAENHLPFLYPEIDWLGSGAHAEMEFPLFPYFISWLYRLFGFSEVWGRLLTILASVGAVWAIAEIGRKIWNPRIGLLAAAVFAASPLAVYFGRTYMADMTMVCCSTGSIAFLLHWQSDKRDRWIFMAAIALALGVLFKPPCLFVALPLAWIVVTRAGWRALAKPQFLISVLIVLFPAFLWYRHAHDFYLETGASFMRHFENFTFQKNLLGVWLDPIFSKTIAARWNDQVLAFIGTIPFAIGIVRLLFPYRNRAFLWLWLAGTAVFYLVIPGHHIGHDYYTLLAIPPLALVTAIGCETIAVWLEKRKPKLGNTVYIFPALMLVIGFSLLISRGWYRNNYFFYQDAIAAKSYLPKNSLILVMDELIHTPEFFYYTECKGWRRLNESSTNRDDSDWIEEHRAKGARFYFGLNEGGGNHPMAYLQTHTVGRYMLDHYQFKEIGFRHFTSLLDKPVYGKHLYAQLIDKTVALPDSARMDAGSFLANPRPLDSWQEADAIVLDFHLLAQNEQSKASAVYSEAVRNGFAITRQQSGRLLLERTDRIEPVPGLLPSVKIVPIENRKASENPNSAITLGRFEPGDYRISFHLPEIHGIDKIKLEISKSEGAIVSERNLGIHHLPLLKEGERPECYVHLDAPQSLKALVCFDDTAISPKSVVIMPNVQCIPADVLFQTERLYTQNADVVTDTAADGGKALRAKSKNELQAMCYGPYYEFPPGDYDFSFRIRTSDNQTHGTIKLGLYNAQGELNVHELNTAGISSTDYQDINFQTSIPQLMPIETAISLRNYAEVLADTIRIRHRRRMSSAQRQDRIIGLVPLQNRFVEFSENGIVSDTNGRIEKSIERIGRTIQTATWHSKYGALFADSVGDIFNIEGSLQWNVPCTPGEQIFALAFSSDGSALSALTTSRKGYIHSQDRDDEFNLPQYMYPPCDLAMNGTRDVFVLYKDGKIHNTAAASALSEGLNFGSDVARALVPHPKGLYVVDCSGAIHNLGEAPPVHSPFYNAEDWVADAWRTSDGRWALLSREGEILEFKEQ